MLGCNCLRRFQLDSMSYHHTTFVCTSNNFPALQLCLPDPTTTKCKKKNILYQYRCGNPFLIILIPAASLDMHQSKDCSSTSAACANFDSTSLASSSVACSFPNYVCCHNKSFAFCLYLIEVNRQRLPEIHLCLSTVKQALSIDFHAILTYFILSL